VISFFQNRKQSIFCEGSLVKAIVIVLLFVTLGVGQLTITAQPKVSATIDQDSILMGDRMVLHLETVSHKADEIVWPLIAGKLQDVDVIGNSKLDTTFFGDSLRISASIYLSVYQPGMVAIPGIEFKYKRKRSNRSVRTKPLMVNVSGMEIDTTKGIVGLKPPIEVKRNLKEWLPFVIAFWLFWLILGGVLYCLFRKKKQHEDYIHRKEIIRPSHEIALEGLNQLKAEKLPDTGQHKEYYVRLTDIIRTYVESRFDVPAMESTTDEIIAGLLKTDVNKKTVEKMEDIFNEADLAKFAKAKPDVTLCKKGMKDSFDFVQHTKIKEEEAQLVETIEVLDSKRNKEKVEGAKPKSDKK